MVQKPGFNQQDFLWYQPDGNPVACKEKIKLLEENRQEIQQNLQDVFEDALLMGVDEIQMRKILKAMVDQLRSPIV